VEAGSNWLRARRPTPFGASSVNTDIDQDQGLQGLSARRADNSSPYTYRTPTPNPLFLYSFVFVQCYKLLAFSHTSLA
jgi:hypothetical protein